MSKPYGPIPGKDTQMMFKQVATGHWRIWTGYTTSERFRWWKASHLRIAWMAHRERKRWQ